MLCQTKSREVLPYQLNCMQKYCWDPTNPVLLTISVEMLTWYWGCLQPTETDKPSSLLHMPWGSLGTGPWKWQRIVVLPNHLKGKGRIVFKEDSPAGGVAQVVEHLPCVMPWVQAPLLP
jgi:hypothetical protein